MTKNSQVLPKDKNNNAIQNSSGFLLNDASEVILNSPIDSGTTDILFKFPLNAIKLYIYGVDENIRLKQGSNYCTIPKQAWFAIGGLPNDVVVIGRPDETSVEFAFDILQ